MNKILVLSILTISCSGEPKQDEVKNHASKTETQEMVELLASLTEGQEPNGYQNSKLAASYSIKLKNQNEAFDFNLWNSYCRELLRSNQNEKCIYEIETNLSKREATYQSLIEGNMIQILELLGLAYLRLGEVENCQKNHNAFSCIIPLRKEAFYASQSGSKKAIEIYSLLFENNPQDKYKWLLNIAYMTLGKHPAQIPKQLLIDYPNWKSETKNFSPFKEISSSLGIAMNGLSGGTCVEDFNNDGLLDIFATSWGIGDQARLFMNTGKGFEDKTASAGLTGIVGGLNCIHADYNNDGYRDILILRGAWLKEGGKHPNSLLKNNGDGTFSDVTKSAGILSFHPTQTASWADVNKDGFLDLFIGNEHEDGSNHPSELYVNQQDGTFKEESEKHGLGKIKANVKGVTFGDINNDQWPDLFVSVLGGQNLLYQNREGKFVEIGQKAGVHIPIFSFPCWFWDINNDGFEDLFVGSYDGVNLNNLAGDFAMELQEKKVTTTKPRLFINRKDGTFKESRDAFGLNRTMYSMGSNFGDLDNDGWLDFYIGTGAPDFSTIVPNRMFRNIDGKRFEEVTSAGRFGHIQKGHAVAFADLDKDGDQDIYAVMGGAYEGDQFTNVLFENPGFNNNWIVLDLKGSKSTRDAIGSKIEVKLKDGRTIYHVVSSGGSFGASSLQAEIGIGKSNQITSITVFWQNSPKQIFTELKINSKYQLIEGEPKAIELEYETLPFNTKPKGHQHHHH